MISGTVSLLSVLLAFTVTWITVDWWRRLRRRDASVCPFCGRALQELPPPAPLCPAFHTIAPVPRKPAPRSPRGHQQPYAREWGDLD